MKSHRPLATELIVPLPIADEWLVLEQNPTNTSSYLRVIAADGTELSYQPIRLGSSDSWVALRKTLLIGSAVSPYIDVESTTSLRALVRSHIHGVCAYDFECGVCVLENGTEISVDECEIIRRRLANHIGVEILPVPSGSQRSVDLAIQLVRQSPDAIRIGGPLARARLHRRLAGLDGRFVTVHFADGGTSSGVVERTGECLPRYCLRSGEQERCVDPSASILMVDLTEGNDGDFQELAS